MKRNILWNRPEPTQTEIDNRQDFSKILNSVSNTTPFYQTKWFLGGIAIVTGITISLAFIDSNEPSEEFAMHNADAAPKDQPNLNIQKEEVVVKEHTDSDILSENLIEEQPTIKQPEKATEKETTIGSLEITNDILSEALYEDLANLESQKKEILSIAPVMPSEISEPSRVISSKADLSEFPELSKYSSIKFEVTNDNPIFSPSLLKEEWQNHVLSKTDINGIYLLDMEKNGQHLYLKVSPVVEASQFENAKAQFETESQNHQEKLEFINSQIDSLNLQIAEL